MGWRNGSRQFQMSTLMGSGASLGSGLGAAAMPKKSRPPSFENWSLPFSLTARPAGKPLASAGTSSVAAVAATRSTASEACAVLFAWGTSFTLTAAGDQ